MPPACGVAGWALSVGLIGLDRATPSFAALDLVVDRDRLLQAIAGPGRVHLVFVSVIVSLLLTGRTSRILRPAPITERLDDLAGGIGTVCPR